MAQTGFTPISLYSTTTASAVPLAGNLVAGELAINTTDGKMYFKNTGGAVTLLASVVAASGVLTNSTGLPLTTGVVGVLPVLNGGSGVTTSTGTGSVVLNTNPTLVTPALGTPSSGVLTNATGLPLTTGVSGTLPVLNGGSGVTTSTGSGSNVLNTSPSLVTPVVDSLNGGQLAEMRNRIINGDMRISQRGSSFASGAAQYTLDRWQFYRGASATGATCTFASTSSIPGYINANYAQIQRNSGDTNTNSLSFQTSLESINIKDFAGKTITLSFFGFCSGGTIGNTTCQIISGTGTDSSLAVGFSGQATAATITLAGSATWTKNTVTVTLPSTATQLGLSFAYTPTGTAGASDFFGVSYVQLELGTVATPFGQISYGTQLSLCQRYFEIGTTRTFTYSSSVGASPASSFGFSVTKRVTPTMAFIGTPIFSNATAVAFNSPSIAVSGSGTDITVSPVGAAVATFNFSASSEL